MRPQYFQAWILISEECRNLAAYAHQLGHFLIIQKLREQGALEGTAKALTSKKSFLCRVNL